MILSRTIGIDLGTTNSAVALLDPNERDLVLARDDQGRTTLPSCVWSHPRTGEIEVGHRAYARRGSSPAPICSIKRSMGTQMTVALGGAQRTPAEISAYILRDLKALMEAELRRHAPDVQYQVDRAIITVPAYFGLPAIEATREAGRLAGLEVMELLHEPTAAAIYYSWKHDLGDGVYLVYDLGGGTFDVSVLRRTAGEFLVLGISGDNFLGGDDFDRRLAEHLRELLVADGYELELDVATDPEDALRLTQLVALAERAKKQLSDQEEIVLRDQTLRDKSGVPVVLETQLARATCEGLIGDLLDRTLRACDEALDKARVKGGVTLADVDHILLVGGSTYVPAVMRKVQEALCGAGRRVAAPIRDEPETAVALGAGLRAAAGGLGIGDDERRLRLWFRSAGATRRERTTLGGQVEPLLQDLDLGGGQVRLTGPAGEPLGQVELRGELRFAFPGVALQAEALNQFQFQVLTRAGTEVARVQRVVARPATQREAVGRALSTAVLPKPIVLLGTDGGRLVRQVLLAEGSSLPAQARFTFAVADPQGRVRLPIYQENRIIKELEAHVGPVAVGTPVEIDIACDEQVRIQVRFWVGEREFGGRIEAPPPDAVPTEFVVQQIDQRFREALGRLDEPEQQQLAAAYETARKDLIEARAGMDYPKVIQRAADLEGLIREARLREPLRPPLQVVEQNVRSCLELLPQAARIKAALAPPSLRQDLEGVLEKARRAYAERDRPGYLDAARAIAATLELLVGVTRAQVAQDQDVDVAVRALLAVHRSGQMMQFLLVSCLMAGKTQFVDGLQRHIQEIDGMEEEAGEDPVRVLNRCQVLMTEAQRLFEQIRPQDRQGAELAGLLQIKEQAGPPGPQGKVDGLIGGKR